MRVRQTMCVGLLASVVALTGCAPTAPAPTVPAAPAPTTQAGSPVPQIAGSPGAAAASPSAVASIAPVPAVASPGVAGPMTTVSVALPTIALSQAPYLIAREKGYYAEEGIDADLQVSPPNVGVEGTVAGSFAFTGAAAQAAVARLSGTGAPLKVVFNHNNTVTWWLVATQKSGITRVEDLKGKTIAIEGPGTLSATYTRALLQLHGLNPDTDVQFVSAGPVANWLVPVLGGTVDAGIAPDADSYVSAKEQGLVEVARYGEEIHAPLSGLATRDALLQDDFDLVKRFLKGSLKGLMFYRANKADSVAIISRLTGQDPQETAAAYDVLVPFTSEVPILDAGTQQDLLDLVKASLNVDRDVPLSDVYDYRAAQQALQELQAEGWTPS